MPLARKIATFHRLAWTDKGLVIEAVLWLAIARVIVLATPFRRVARRLENMPGSAECDAALCLRVRRAITIAARNVPWDAVCLPQAMAAKAMLARRGHASVLHLGVGHDPDGKFIAHAWLVAGDTIVVGAAGVAGLSPLARFG